MHLLGFRFNEQGNASISLKKYAVRFRNAECANKTGFVALQIAACVVIYQVFATFAGSFETPVNASTIFEQDEISSFNCRS